MCNPKVVASAAGDAASRMALFGSINSASAFVIVLLQLAATGRLLKRLGLATALTVSPAFAAALMLGIAVSPTPLVVAAGEVLRKVSLPGTFGNETMHAKFYTLILVVAVMSCFLLWFTSL